MKNKILKIALTVVFASLILFGIALYVYEITVKGISPTENIYKLLVLVISGILGLTKLYTPKRTPRRSPAFYERAYAKELGDAFSGKPKARGNLVRATMLYNEGKFDAAIKLLTALESECECRADIHSVELFKALTLTDSGDSHSAAGVYEKMIRNGIYSSTVFGNLGSIYTQEGRERDAREMLSLAIEADPNNPAPHQNLAALDFDIGNLTAAKTHATSALAINARYKPAASLLAIIYYVEKNKDEEAKWTAVAISAGEKPDALDRAKSYYANLASIAPTAEAKDGGEE